RGKNKGLALGSTGPLPLIWRSFSMPELDEGPMLQSQVRALEALLIHCGVENAPGAIFVHGRPDIRERLQGDVFIQKLGTRLQWTDGPGLDAAAIAHGLALGAVSTEHDGFDLARSLKPPLSFREMLPWKEIAAQVAMALGVGLF